MRTLAIETVDQAGSVAALSEGRTLGIHTLDAGTRSAQSLAPAIVDLLHNVGWNPRDVQLVAVAVGPGSFTGLRVGITTAKLFAYTVGASILGISTLEAIANQAAIDIHRLWVVLDALRDQVFASRFSRAATGDWQCDVSPRLLNNTAWLANLSPNDSVSGPALTKLATLVPTGVTIVDRALWCPTAPSVGQLAWRQHQAGRRDDLFSLLPQYFRPSAAEEKRGAQRAQ